MSESESYPSLLELSSFHFLALLMTTVMLSESSSEIPSSTAIPLTPGLFDFSVFFFLFFKHSNSFFDFPLFYFPPQV